MLGGLRRVAGPALAGCLLAGAVQLSAQAQAGMPWQGHAELGEQMQRLQAEVLAVLREPADASTLRQRCDALQSQLDGARFGAGGEGRVWVFAELLPAALAADQALFMVEGPVECGWRALAVSLPRGAVLPGSLRAAATRALSDPRSAAAPEGGPPTLSSFTARRSWGLLGLALLLTGLIAWLAGRFGRRAVVVVAPPLALPQFSAPDDQALRQARQEQALLLQQMQQKAEQLEQELDRVRQRVDRRPQAVSQGKPR